VNRERRQRAARRVRAVLGEDADVRYMIPTSTGRPNRNWLVAVTRDDFVVFRVDWLGRPKSVSARAPRTRLQPKTTATGKRVILIGTDEHYVPVHHLNEVDFQNRDFRARH
jgi:hypothetical protein